MRASAVAVSIGRFVPWVRGVGRESVTAGWDSGGARKGTRVAMRGDIKGTSRPSGLQRGEPRICLRLARPAHDSAQRGTREYLVACVCASLCVCARARAVAMRRDAALALTVFPTC